METMLARAAKKLPWDMHPGHSQVACGEKGQDEPAILRALGLFLRQLRTKLLSDSQIAS